MTLKLCLQEALLSIASGIKMNRPKGLIDSFKPHVHFNDCLSAHSVFTSLAILSQLSLLRRYSTSCVSLSKQKNEKKKNKSSFTRRSDDKPKHSFSPCRVHKWLQQHLSTGFNNYRNMLIILHSSVILSSLLFPVFTEECSSSLPIVMYLIKP